MKLVSIVNNICGHISVFGIKRGIIVYFKIKTKRTQRLILNGIKHPICLRPKSSDIPIFHQIFYLKEYEIQFEFSPKIIIDAGANIGLAAIYYTNRYPKAKIICIEPEGSNFEMLRKNTKEYPNTITINKALSNIDNQNLLVKDNGFGTSGFMTELKDPSSYKDVKNHVKTTTISRIMTENSLDFIDIVKIDIEGYEKELFESNTDNWIPKTRCIIIELHDRMKPGCSKSFFQAISQHDFSFSSKGENLIFINKNFVNQNLS